MIPAPELIRALVATLREREMGPWADALESLQVEVKALEARVRSFTEVSPGAGCVMCVDLGNHEWSRAVGFAVLSACRYHLENPSVEPYELLVKRRALQAQVDELQKGISPSTFRRAVESELRAEKAEAQRDALAEALRWYGYSEPHGDLAADGGARARTTLTEQGLERG